MASSGKPIGPGPRTKEELVNKITAIDFSGDLRDLGEDARVERDAKNAIKVSFPKIGREYILSVHLPRGERKATKVAKGAPEPDTRWSIEPGSVPRKQ
jgi:hypothetical protein